MVFHMYYGHYIISIFLWSLYQFIYIMANISTISWLSFLQVIWLSIHIHLAVDPDNNFGLISEEKEQQTPRSQTTPTPDHDQPSPSPPRLIRLRAMAQLRPVSIPNIVSNMAGPKRSRRQRDPERPPRAAGPPNRREVTFVIDRTRRPLLRRDSSPAWWYPRCVAHTGISLLRKCPLHAHSTYWEQCNNCNNCNKCHNSVIIAYNSK